MSSNFQFTEGSMAIVSIRVGSWQALSSLWGVFVVRPVVDALPSLVCHVGDPGLGWTLSHCSRRPRKEGTGAILRLHPVVLSSYSTIPSTLCRIVDKRVHTDAAEWPCCVFWLHSSPERLPALLSCPSRLWHVLNSNRSWLNVFQILNWYVIIAAVHCASISLKWVPGKIF